MLTWRLLNLSYQPIHITFSELHVHSLHSWTHCEKGIKYMGTWYAMDTFWLASYPGCYFLTHPAKFGNFGLFKVARYIWSSFFSRRHIYGFDEQGEVGAWGCWSTPKFLAFLCKNVLERKLVPQTKWDIISIYPYPTVPRLFVNGLGTRLPLHGLYHHLKDQLKCNKWSWHFPL